MSLQTTGTVAVVTTLLDMAGKKVGESESNLTVDAGSQAEAPAEHFRG